MASNLEKEKKKRWPVGVFFFYGILLLKLMEDFFLPPFPANFPPGVGKLDYGGVNIWENKKFSFKNGSVLP